MKAMTTDFETRLFSNKKWNWSYDKVFVKPNIPSKKLLNALTYAPDISPDEVLILIDDTVFGGAKEGMLVTTSGVYCHELMTEPDSYTFSQIKKIGMEKKSQVMVNGRKFFKGQMVDHLALLTITARIQSVLADIQSEQSAETTSDGQEAAPSQSNASSQNAPTHRPEAPKNRPKDPLKFSAQDDYYTAIKQMKGVNTATSVVAFFLGDANENKPVSKIVEDFTNTAYKSVLLFRKIVIEGNGAVNLANNSCTIEVLCYSAAKLFQQLSAHAVPESILTAIQRKGIPDALLLKDSRGVETVMTVIAEYIKGMQGEEALLELLVRIFITNQEQKFITEIQPYAHHIVDSDGQGFSHDFSTFVGQNEKAMQQFEAELDRLVNAHVENALNVIHKH